MVLLRRVWGAGAGAVAAAAKTLRGVRRPPATPQKLVECTRSALPPLPFLAEGALVASAALPYSVEGAPASVRPVALGEKRERLHPPHRTLGEKRQHV